MNDSTRTSAEADRCATTGEATGSGLVPVRVKLALRLIALQFGLLLVLRLVFLVLFRASGGELGVGDILRAIFVGLRFDLRLVLLLTLPLILLGWIPVLDPLRSRSPRRAWVWGTVFLGTALLLFYFVDLAHYDYLHERVNSGLLDQMLSPGIAAGMVWESYPVIWGLVCVALFMLAWGWLLARFVFVETHAESPPLTAVTRRCAWAVFALLVGFGMYGKFSWYPLRWSDAYAFENPFATALALNPLLFFADSFPDREAPYDEQRVREQYDTIATLLEVDQPDPESLDFSRLIDPGSGVGDRPNLIIVHLESWSGFQTGVLGEGLNPASDLDPSPHFDALAAEGLLFSHFLVPRGPTARSVFSMLTGLPDMNPLHSASRNPRVVNQHTLINALEGYEKFYFLGGSATWANIRGILAHNIHGLRIFEEGDYQAPRGDVWGISDLVLFEESLATLDEVQGSFFAFIQTSGNHRPYTIPEDSQGFEVLEADGDVLLANGFPNAEAYNGFRFLDHSVGHLIAEARKRDFFENTIFVFYGDHGIPAPHGIPWETLGLPTLHVPFLIYAPALIPEARRYDQIASSVDILPTCLGLMGVPYRNQTLGRDLRVERPADRHFAFMEHGWLDDEFCMRLGKNGKARLYRYRSEEPDRNVAQEVPEVRDAMLERYLGFREWSLYMLHNNRPREHPAQVVGE